MILIFFYNNTEVDLLQSHMSEIQNLPRELIIEIFTFLPTLCLVQLERACTLFYDLLNSNIDTTYNIYEERASRLNQQHVDYFTELGISKSKIACCAEWKYLIIGTSEEYLPNVKHMVSSSGLNVTAFDPLEHRRLPIDILYDHHAVLVFGDADTFITDDGCTVAGDALADYVDQGYGVVECVFANCHNCDSGHLAGRFKFQNYHPMPTSVQENIPTGQFGDVRVLITDPEHIIMQNVDTSTFRLERYSDTCLPPPNFGETVAKDPSLHVIAEFVSDEKCPAVMTRDRTKIGHPNSGKIVLINFFPGDKWACNSDVSKLLINALIYCSF
jgi:hypothetical protein